jgi:hypothetical protein
MYSQLSQFITYYRKEKKMFTTITPNFIVFTQQMKGQNAIFYLDNMSSEYSRTALAKSRTC